MRGDAGAVYPNVYPKCITNATKMEPKCYQKMPPAPCHGDKEATLADKYYLATTKRLLPQFSAIYLVYRRFNGGKLLELEEAQMLRADVRMREGRPKNK